MKIIAERGNNMNMVKVKNIHAGDRKPPAGYSSWLSFWKDMKGIRQSESVICANLACTYSARHGGHVKKVKSDDGRWYIVPLCVSCNEDKDKEFVVDASSLVRASI